MSDLHDSAEPTQPLPSFEPQPEGGRGRRAAVVGGVAALVVAALGGAAFAAYSFLDGGGPRPEDALPDTTVAVLSVDLDPHAGQKIEAIKTLRKFPALRKQLGLSSEDDLRRYIVDKGIKSDCEGIDYDRDVKPWVGKRAAFAAVDLGDDQPAPALVVQVSDAARATKDFGKLADCAGEDFGYVVGEDYLVASDSDAHARKILDAGKKKPLADDATFQKWDGEAGDGVAGFYIAPRAARYLDDLLADFGNGFTEFDDEISAGASAPVADDPLDPVHDALRDFHGAAGALKFADGGLELVVAADAGKQKLGDKPIGEVVDRLPADTALVLGISFPKHFGSTLLDQAKAQLGEAEVQEFLDDARTEAGLDLPGDAEDLLGDALTLSVSGDAPSSADALDNPTELPAALALHGDPDKSLAVLHKLEKALGTSLSDIPLETKKSGDALLLSPSEDYLGELAKKGSLGDSDVFRQAVPDADHAGMVFFTVIDEDWRKTIVDLASSDLSPSEARTLAENLKPFRALGLSSTVKDGVGRFELRITTR
ncbi:MAG: DUF3352 domain-containing protein [Nocardioidaceae bacterium]|nr:DUF3352 domain-containing protein [Nocardioidaceae bacterium]